MRIRKILDSARITLADKQKQRFSDEDLLVFLNQGLQDFCQRTKILRDRKVVEVSKNETDIRLPTETILLERVIYEDTILPFYSYQELDSQQNLSSLGDFFTYYNSLYSHRGNWELETGRPRALLWDKRVNDLIRIYPIPENKLFLTPLNQVFGVVTDSKINTNIFGVLSYNFGVVTEIQKKLELEVQYVKTHSEISLVEGDLETPAMYDTALQHFICCQSFLSNLDNQYTEKATLQRQLYDQYVNRAMIEVSRNFTRAKQFRTPYRRGV